MGFILGQLSAFLQYNIHEAYLATGFQIFLLLFLYFPPELQAAVCIHRDPAPFAEHSEGLLETGAGLPLHVHSDAQRRGPSAGKPDLIHGHKHTYNK